MEALSLWYTGREQAELRRETLAPRARDQLRIHTRFSAISRGTERLVYQGRVPESEHPRMRAPFQEGTFPFPVKYGYANVGRIEGSGEEVFCLYPHQTVFDVPSAALIALPADVPAARAVLAANMETALNAIWDAQLHAGDRVCVIGAGVVGALCAYLAARHPGCEVDVIEPDQARHAAVQAFGATVQTREDYDVVLHASGHPAGLTTALAIAGFEARIVELSWYGDLQVVAPLGAAFHARRLQLVSSQVGHVAAAQRARWTHRRRLGKAIALLADPALDLLFGEDVAFARLPSALAGVFAGSAHCTRVVYPENDR
jgi:threonine dehydrogenase-like Zn-dependent dehydrogenase